MTEPMPRDLTASFTALNVTRNAPLLDRMTAAVEAAGSSVPASLEMEAEIIAAVTKTLRLTFPEALVLDAAHFESCSFTEKSDLVRGSTGVQIFLLSTTADARPGKGGVCLAVAALRQGQITAAAMRLLPGPGPMRGAGHHLAIGDGSRLRINGRATLDLSDRRAAACPRQLHGYAEAGSAFDTAGQFMALDALPQCGDGYRALLTGQAHFMLLQSSDLAVLSAGAALTVQAGGVARYQDGTPVSAAEIFRRRSLPRNADNTLILAVSEDVFAAVRGVLDHHAGVTYPRGVDYKRLGL